MKVEQNGFVIHSSCCINSVAIALFFQKTLNIVWIVNYLIFYFTTNKTIKNYNYYFWRLYATFRVDRLHIQNKSTYKNLKAIFCVKLDKNSLLPITTFALVLRKVLQFVLLRWMGLQPFTKMGLKFGNQSENTNILVAASFWQDINKLDISLISERSLNNLIITM